MAVKTVEVLNTKTCDEDTFVDHTPRNAVIAAYAQSKDDWEMDGYEAKYGARVKRETRKGVILWRLGHFCSSERM